MGIYEELLGWVDCWRIKDDAAMGDEVVRRRWVEGCGADLEWIAKKHGVLDKL